MSRYETATFVYKRESLMGAAESLDPNASLWHAIAVNLRKERKRRGLTLAQVAEVINAECERVDNRTGSADRQTIGSYEANRRHITEEHAEALDRAWGTMFSVYRRFAVLYGRDDDWNKQLEDFETGARIIKIYFRDVIPIPLQIEDYAEAFLRSCRIVQDIALGVRQRIARRKKLLDQLTKGMALWVLIEEDALVAPGISREVMARQVSEIIELSQRVSVRIVPASAPVHIGTDGSLELITTASGSEVAYVWAHLGGRLVHEATDVNDLAVRYDRIGARALTEEASLEHLNKIKERLQ